MKYIVFVAFIAVTSAAIATPNKYDTNGSFQPSLRYYEPENRTDNHLKSSDHIESKLPIDDDRIQRFGTSGFGGTGAGYPHSGTGVSTYAPMKIDLGGVILGTLIGLGAILLLPKIANIFQGGYKRSVDDADSFTDILAKIDKALDEHHIDSSTCMQRIVCSYVQESQENIAIGQSNTIDDLIFSVTNNSMMSFLLDGTAIQQAVKLGKNNDPESCASLYSKCPISRENIMQIVTSLLPA